MNASFVVKAVCGVFGVVSAVIGIGAAKSYADSRQWGLDRARELRTEETAKVFSDKDRAFKEASVIFSREDKEYNAGEAALKAAYNESVRKTNAVLASERNAVTMHVSEMTTQHSLSEIKCRNIRASEESRLEDMLKHDGEYKAYKETRKIRKEAGKSIDKVEAKMARRKSEIREAIEGQRSEAERKAFQDRDYYAREMSDTSDFANSLVQQRTVEDKAKFAEMKRLSDELGNRKARRNAITSKRTIAEQDAVNRYNSLAAKAKAIETAEAAGLDRLNAYAGYLKRLGWTPREIAFLGSIPLLTVVSLFGCLVYKYVSMLNGLVTAMSVA